LYRQRRRTGIALVSRPKLTAGASRLILICGRAVARIVLMMRLFVEPIAQWDQRHMVSVSQFRQRATSRAGRNRAGYFYNPR